MDDGIYLLLARNIARSPWFPQDFSIYFEGLYATDLASIEHPVPLTSYYMALIGRVVHGFTELNLHLAFSIFTLMLAWGMFALARRYTGHALLASLTFMFLPAVYVLSHTLMTDVPQIALWVASVVLFIHGIDARKTIWLLAGAFAATLACFVSYSSLCLIPLLALLASCKKDRRALAVILVLPCMILGAWLAVSLSHYGRLPPAQLLGSYFAVKRVLSPVLLIQKCIYIVLVIGGGVMMFPLGLLVGSRKSVIAAALLLTAPAMWISGASHYALAEKLMFILFFCVGIGAIGAIISDFTSGREKDLFLGIWFIGMLLFAAIFYMTGSARYLFTAMPPFVLLFYRRMECRWGVRKVQWIGGTNLVLGASLAVVMAAADYQFAGIYREFASKFFETYSTGQKRVWFVGEWGLRAYLEGSGAEELGRRDARPRKGDILAVATLATPYHTLFDDQLPLDSIVLVAPSQLRFSLPKISGGSVLAFTVGMPLAEKSHGLNLTITFETGGRQQQIYSERISPAGGAVWATRQVPLSDTPGAGSLVFSSEVSGGDAIANRVAIARARISKQNENGEVVLYDFRRHLSDARIESEPTVEYHTPDNLPVFPMTVWLRQEPATILRGVYNYRTRIPVRLIDGSVHAGFWSMGWGILPFSFAGNNSDVETIRVYEIIRESDAYGETAPGWYESGSGS